jgi:hypothetical protein
MSKYIYLIKMSVKFGKLKVFEREEIVESLDFITENIDLLSPKDLTNLAYSLSKAKCFK